MSDETHPAEMLTPSTAQYRLWALHMPFRRTGSPVVAGFGHTDRSVVIMEMATWQRLCADVPQLQATEFEVGTFE